VELLWTWVVMGMIGAEMRRESAPAARAESIEEMCLREITTDETLNHVPALSALDCSNLQGEQILRLV